MIPLSACPDLAPNVPNVGAGPDNMYTMLAPSAILSTSLSFLRNKAPPRCLFQRFNYCSLIKPFQYYPASNGFFLPQTSESSLSFGVE